MKKSKNMSVLGPGLNLHHSQNQVILNHQRKIKRKLQKVRVGIPKEEKKQNTIPQNIKINPQRLLQIQILRVSFIKL